MTPPTEAELVEMAARAEREDDNGAEFFEHAREDVPRLIAALREEREHSALLRGALERLASWSHNVANQMGIHPLRGRFDEIASQVKKALRS